MPRPISSGYRSPHDIAWGLAVRSKRWGPVAVLGERGASVTEPRLTVLGSGVAWANPGGACSGYLYTSGETNLLIECGPGIFGRLRGVLDPSRLDAILVSHLHADHLLDLVPFRYGLKYGGIAAGRRLCLLVPPGGARFLDELGQALDGGTRFFSDVFDLAEYDPAAPLAFGDVTVRFRPVQHYVPAFAMRFEADRTLAFSADAAPCDALVEHAAGADVLLCEASLHHTGDDQPIQANRGHHTAAEAGVTATRAGVGRLLLTHAPLEPDDPERAAREARAHFAGPVARVVDGETYLI